MRKIGHILFRQRPEWLVKTFAGRFEAGARSILRSDPEMSEGALARAILDRYAPQPLSIEEPVSTEMPWEAGPYLQTNGETADLYHHQARLPYRGTRELWRMRGGVSRAFRTRVSLTNDYARLHLLLPDRDVEHFRAIVAEELAWAREVAGSQSAGIGRVKVFMPDAVENFFRSTDLYAIRYAARDYKERSDKASAHLFE